ncbi:MAG: hypothetical protein ACM3JC_09400 [Rudaea sp.]
MSVREIAELRDESIRKNRSLLTSGEAFTCACWGLLLVVCVMQETFETLFA